MRPAHHDPAVGHNDDVLEGRLKPVAQKHGAFGAEARIHPAVRQVPPHGCLSRPRVVRTCDGAAGDEDAAVALDRRGAKLERAAVGKPAHRDPALAAEAGVPRAIRVEAHDPVFEKHEAAAVRKQEQFLDVVSQVRL
jgi:hypothetical protein